MFNNYPYTDYHELNTDWIIGKIKNIETSEANAKQSAEDADTARQGAVDAQDAAEHAQGLAEDAQTAAEDAQRLAENARDAAQGFAGDAEQTVEDTINQIALLQSRVDNIIPDGTQTVGNTELLDIRVGYDGFTYDSAGNAVRDQVSDLNDKVADVFQVDAYSVYNDTDFTVVKSDNTFTTSWTTLSFGAGAILFDTKKIKILPSMSEIVIAHNTSYDRVVYINISNGEIVWQAKSNSSSHAIIDTISTPGLDRTAGITITQDSITQLTITDGTNSITVNTNNIVGWNATLYPVLEIGVYLNTFQINGSVSAVVLDDFNTNKKFVEYLIGNATSLYGKKICLLGDSYIDGPDIATSENWWYLLADKYNMVYQNEGVGGNCMVFDNGSGTNPMVLRYTDLDNDADIVIVQGGKNDFNWRASLPQASMDDDTFKATFKSGVETLCMGLIKKYRNTGATIIFGTPWSFPCSDDPMTGVYIPFKESAGFTIPIQWFTDTIISVCNKFGIPVFDCSRNSGVHLWTKTTEMQDSWAYTFMVHNMDDNPDYSHLNAEGMKYIMPIWERFIMNHFSNYTT